MYLRIIWQLEGRSWWRATSCLGTGKRCVIDLYVFTKRLGVAFTCYNSFQTWIHCEKRYPQQCLWVVGFLLRVLFHRTYLPMWLQMNLDIPSHSFIIIFPLQGLSTSAQISPYHLSRYLPSKSCHLIDIFSTLYYVFSLSIVLSAMEVARLKLEGNCSNSIILIYFCNSCFAGSLMFLEGTRPRTSLVRRVPIPATNFTRKTSFVRLVAVIPLVNIPAFRCGCQWSLGIRLLVKAKEHSQTLCAPFSRILELKVLELYSISSRWRLVFFWRLFSLFIVKAGQFSTSMKGLNIDMTGMTHLKMVCVVGDTWLLIL